MPSLPPGLPASGSIRPKRLARAFRAFGLLATAGGFALAGLLASLWLDHRKETFLPEPSGPFAVGRTTYAWTDPAQADPMAPPGAPRELLAWIWYPAAPGRREDAAGYLPAAWRKAVENRVGPLLATFLTRDLSRVHAHGIGDAAVAQDQRSYPVIFLRAGLAALTTNYTSLAEDLASHGYVVVGFDAPYRSFVVVLPDGTVIARAPRNNAELFAGAEQQQLAVRLVEAWSADMRFALDRLERLNASDPASLFSGRLDLRRVGVFGHSLGGATALQFCHDDPRCKAGADVDGAPLGSVLAEGVTQPFLFLLSSHGNEPVEETRPVLANIRSIYDRLPPDRRVEIEIRGANHFLFSDDGALLKSPALRRTLRIFGILGIDGRRQLAITSYCLRTFFDAYLKRTGPSPQMLSSSLYPEIQVLK